MLMWKKDDKMRLSQARSLNSKLDRNRRCMHCTVTSKKGGPRREALLLTLDDFPNVHRRHGPPQRHQLRGDVLERQVQDRGLLPHHRRHVDARE
jgi:hypothetical protein